MDSKKKVIRSGIENRREERRTCYEEIHSSRRTAQLPPAPVLKCSPIVTNSEWFKNWRRAERDFFASYVGFCHHKNITPQDFSQDAFPLNIWNAYQHAGQHIETNNEEYLSLVKHTDSELCIMLRQPLDIHNKLYYIPIQPVYYAWSENSDDAGLLLSCCSYLRCIVDTPSFLNGSSVHWFYQLLQENLENDYYGDEEELIEAQNALDAIFNEGAIIMKEINRPVHLRSWESRLELYPDKESELWQVSNNLFRLFRQFPKATIHRHIIHELYDPNADRNASLDQYFSFVWQKDGGITEQMVEYISEQLMEADYIEKPMQSCTFCANGKVMITDLSFENKLLNLIDDFANILYN